MSYTEEETTAAVQALVKGTLSFPSNKLGPRDVNTPFQEAVELIHSVLLYEPDAIFLLIYLAKNNAVSVLNAADSTAELLAAAVDDLLKPSIPVNDVSGFSDASSALNSMESALSRRGAIGNREYRRYSSATNRITSELGRTVKLTHVPTGSSDVVTEIVRPADEAKRDASDIFSDLEQLHTEVLEFVDQLLVAYLEFQAADLAGSVASYQLSRAATQMRDLGTEMDSLSAAGRILVARDALLGTMSNRAVVRSLAERVDPGAPKLFQGTTGATVYRLSAYGVTGDGTPPSLTGNVSAPWAIESGVNDELRMELNGSGLVTIDLLPSGESRLPGISEVELVGSKAGPFRIGASRVVPYPFRTKSVSTGGSYTVNTYTLYMVVDGVSLSHTFTANYFAADLASTIDSAFSGYINATATINDGGFDYVEIAWDNTTSPPDNYSDRYMQVTSGVNTATDLAVIPASNTWRVNGPAGLVNMNETRGWSITNRLDVRPNDESTATSVVLTEGAWPEYSRTAMEVASDIDTVGMTHFDCVADIDDHLVISSGSSWKGDGAVLLIETNGVDSPTHNTALELGFNRNQEVRGENVAARTIQNVLNNDATFRVAARATSIRTVLLHSQYAVPHASNSNQLVVSTDLDSDPSTAWVTTGDSTKVEVANGDNRGSYSVTATSWSAGTQTLTITLSRNLRDRDVTHIHSVTVFTEYLSIVSKDSSISGKLDIDEGLGTSVHDALGLPTGEQLSDMRKVLVEKYDALLGWSAFDLSRSRIKVGDLIEDSDQATVATVTSITDAASGLLGVGGVSADTALSAFSILSAAYRAYTSFEISLEDWRDSVAFEDLRRIDKALSPLLLLNSPSRARVLSAVSMINILRSEYTNLSAVFDQFLVAAISQVNNAVAVLREKGYDRAHNLLVSGKIEDFFAITSRTASFSRNMLTAAAQVVTQDINEPTKRRADSEFGDEIDRVATEYHTEDVDPQWDLQDLEPELPEAAIDYFTTGDD